MNWLRLGVLVLSVAWGAPLVLPAARAGNDRVPYLENLPATNPYRDLLLRMEKLPDADREALRAWTDGKSDDKDAPPPVLSEAQQVLANELAKGLAAARSGADSSAPLKADQWPLYYPDGKTDNPAAAILPGISTMRDLARMTVKVADGLPPSEAIGLYASVARLGRDDRGGVTLIEQLTGVAVEGIAQAGVSRRLAEFSPEELRRIGELWASLPPAPDNAEALRGESELFFRPIVDRLILPGLRELLAAEATGTEAEVTVPEEDFTRDLRLCGLVDLGDGNPRISLENTRTGRAFTVAAGAPAEGIELVKVDFENRQAILRRGGNEAIAHLESKRIELRGAKGREVAAFMKDWGAGAPEKWLATIRAHPDGVEGYRRELFAAYDAQLTRSIAEADSPVPPAEVEVSSDDPLLAALVPKLGNVVRSLNSSATQALMFQAAIQHRLGQTQPEAATVAAPGDPWSEAEAPFAFKETPDGGFTLQSAYQVRDGRPVLYKFGAPDAGFVRTQKPKPTKTGP